MSHRGKRQADLVNELGWLKARASKIWNSQIGYRRDTVAEIAEWLGIRPYELLMHPREAEALRRLRSTAAAIVAEDAAPYDPEAPPGSAPAPVRRAG